MIFVRYSFLIHSLNIFEVSNNQNLSKNLNKAMESINKYFFKVYSTSERNIYE